MLFEQIVQKNDEAVRSGLPRQVLDKESRYYGGTLDPATGIAWVNHTTGTPTDMCNWGTALVNPASAFYQDETLLERLQLASEFVLGAQHEDGSISPGWTNYHSPPDTAFVVVGYSQLYKVLEKSGWAPLQPTLDNMKQFLSRSISVMLTGGCHTPNHRWVLCAALGCLYELFGDPRLIERANQWLAEGIDITPDGEWTERSNGIYNAVSDIMLIYAARMLNKPELVEPVRKNLRMMVYLIHPSGEVVTDYSGRQDLGHIHDLSSYYLPYAMLAVQDHDSLFAGMAELSGKILENAGAASVHVLVQMLLDPALQGPFVAEGIPMQQVVPTRYKKILNQDFVRSEYLDQIESAGHQGRIFHSRLHLDFGSPIARIREEEISVTLMTETPSFFALRHGAVRLLALQVSSYFYPGYVPMDEMKVNEDGSYVLYGEQKKGYYGPVKSELLPATASTPISPWYLLPHQERELTHEQTFRVEIEAIPSDDLQTWKLHIKAQEPADVMMQLSFVFGSEGHIVSGEYEDLGQDRALWSGGTLRYESGEEWIELEGGEAAHRSTSVREANLPSNCKVVLVNVMTPVDKVFTLRLSPPTAH
ncbi:hypothetical protein [Saccharibacillus sp. JS10]|uniref:hypothetical protein n=1 Tax=Saccharibacillus sp. JS10 TaxID=2950552 RepID=UPI00210DD26B|nr:hypothetical protein [Saccharibacillus sp. JS10]MCQ4086063.1 hypothetical protein [Saccharibacillus sp. JS10]